MKKYNFSHLICYLFFITLSASASPSENSNPHEIVRTSADLVLATIEEQVQAHGNEVSPAMVQVLLKILEPVVDFDEIARAVMSVQGENITAIQAERFASVFKNSMVRLYLESFIAFEVTEIETSPPEAEFDPSTGRATVQMMATGNGNTFAINYSMRTNTDGVWKVRNIIVDGINLGLTYRNQFSGAMARHNNDIDEVIQTWNEEVEA